MCTQKDASEYEQMLTLRSVQSNIVLAFISAHALRTNSKAAHKHKCTHSRLTHSLAAYTHVRIHTETAHIHTCLCTKQHFRRNIHTRAHNQKTLTYVFINSTHARSTHAFKSSTHTRKVNIHACAFTIKQNTRTPRNH